MFDTPLAAVCQNAILIGELIASWHADLADTLQLCSPTSPCFNGACFVCARAHRMSDQLAARAGGLDQWAWIALTIDLTACTIKLGELAAFDPTQLLTRIEQQLHGASLSDYVALGSLGVNLIVHDGQAQEWQLALHFLVNAHWSTGRHHFRRWMDAFSREQKGPSYHSHTVSAGHANLARALAELNPRALQQSRTASSRRGLKTAVSAEALSAANVELALWLARNRVGHQLLRMGIERKGRRPGTERFVVRTPVLAK